MVPERRNLTDSEQFTGQRVGARLGDPDLFQITNGNLGAFYVNRMKILGFSDHLTRQAARFFKQDADCTANHTVLNFPLVSRDNGLKAL